MGSSRNSKEIVDDGAGVVSDGVWADRVNMVEFGSYCAVAVVADLFFVAYVLSYIGNSFTAANARKSAQTEIDFRRC